MAGIVFALATPARGHVGLNDPNGGEVLEVGSTFTVEWQILIQHNQQNWDLWYSNSGAGGPWISIVQNLPPGSPAVGSVHTYDWTLPDDPTDQARVRVRMDNMGTDYEDISNANFTIEPQGPPPVPTLGEWGLIVMGLLTLTAGTIVYRRRRPAS